MARVCVIGAGIIGLSTAVAIQEKLTSAKVTIIAENFSPNLTSNVAAGFWEPHLLGHTDIELQRKWSTQTFNHLVRLLNSEQQKQCGVALITAYQFFQANDPDVPWWTSVVLGFRKVTKLELDIYPGHKNGFQYTTVLADPKYYMPWLTEKFLANGGKMVKGRISNFEQLLGNYDITVNCTGVKSKFLTNDNDVIPIRGQVLKVEAPWVKIAMISVSENTDEKTFPYIIPGIDSVTLGGTHDEGQWKTEANEDTSKNILRSCTKLCPSLKHAKVLKTAVGLRPARSSVRLEYEKVPTDKGLVHVVHNYGHGGSGYTVHWGCAIDAANLVNQILLKPLAKL